MLPLEHIVDKNFSQVGSHLFATHTGQNRRYLGRVTQVNPEKYTATVELIGMVGNDKKPIVLHQVRVGARNAGAGWGEFNLPWIGQQVEVKFEGGMTTTPGKATIGDRYYTDNATPPSHPLLQQAGHTRGNFASSPGGSFTFQHADGQVTTFQSQPHNVEGSKGNSRSTGVAKSALEGRMDKAAAKSAKVVVSMQAVAGIGKAIAATTKEIASLDLLKARS
jgi:hypothetical protein